MTVIKVLFYAINDDTTSHTHLLGDAQPRNLYSVCSSHATSHYNTLSKQTKTIFYHLEFQTLTLWENPSRRKPSSLDFDTNKIQDPDILSLAPS